MTDYAFLVVYVLMLLFTAGIMLLCYRRIREASREYAKAKSALDGIVPSFNSDLQRQERKIQDVAIRAESASAERLQAIEEIGSRVADASAKIEELATSRDDLLINYDLLKKDVSNLLTKQGEVLEKISKLESLSKGSPEAPQTSAELAIPITRNRVFAPLTETELKIVDLLASEGEKSVPEIRERISLTREHTSRLMKKLYSSGYVERMTARMPYVYRLKREMEDILKREDEAT